MPIALVRGRQQHGINARSEPTPNAITSGATSEVRMEQATAAELQDAIWPDTTDAASWPVVVSRSNRATGDEPGVRHRHPLSQCYGTALLTRSAPLDHR